MRTLCWLIYVLAMAIMGGNFIVHRYIETVVGSGNIWGNIFAVYVSHHQLCNLSLSFDNVISKSIFICYTLEKKIDPKMDELYSFPSFLNDWTWLSYFELFLGESHVGSMWILSCDCKEVTNCNDPFHSMQKFLVEIFII